MAGSTLVPKVNVPAGAHMAVGVQSESSQSTKVSQSSSLPLKQSSGELLQPTTHVPVAQLAVSFALPQLLPQAPQFVSELSRVSQPGADVQSP